jgi:hypothetical protein
MVPAFVRITLKIIGKTRGLEGKNVSRDASKGYYENPGEVMVVDLP